MRFLQHPRDRADRRVRRLPHLVLRYRSLAAHAGSRPDYAATRETRPAMPGRSFVQRI